VDASNVNTIIAYLRNIALSKRVGESEQDALAWLSSQHKEWLLLFDSADDVKLNLHSYFPCCSHGNILITSRNRGTLAYAPNPEANFKVGNLTPDEARSLLLQLACLNDGPSDETRKVSTMIVEVGSIPLSYDDVFNSRTETWLPCTCCGASWCLHLYDPMWTYSLPPVVSGKSKWTSGGVPASWPQG
jgi:hypothetical protein